LDTPLYVLLPQMHLFMIHGTLLKHLLACGQFIQTGCVYK